MPAGFALLRWSLLDGRGLIWDCERQRRWTLLPPGLCWTRGWLQVNLARRLDTITDRGKRWPPGGRCQPRPGRRRNSHLRCSNSVPGRNVVPDGAFVPASKYLLGRIRKVLPHVCTFAPGLHQIFRKSANKDAGQNGDYSPIRCIYREICTDQNSSLHHLHQERRASPRGQPGSGCLWKPRWCKRRGDTRGSPADPGNGRTTGSFVVQTRVQTRCKGVQRSKPGQFRWPGATRGGVRPRSMRPLRIG